MADNSSMFSALSDITEDLTELTLKMENQEFKEKKQKAHSVHNISTDGSNFNKHRKNNSVAGNLLSPPWEKKHSRRTLSDGNWNIRKENSTKNDKNANNNVKTEKKDDLSRTPSLPNKWSVKRAVLYKTELCRSFEETGKCKFGDDCIFAHSEEELRPRCDRHPKYKTRICRTFWEQGTCPYGKRCCFIHTERDITHPDDFSVFEAQMQQQQQQHYNNTLAATSLLNASHRRMQSAPEIVHKHRPSNSSDTFMGGIYSMTPFDRRSLNSEKSSIRSFDTNKESSKLKEEIKMNVSSDEDSEEDKQTPDVVLMDETGSITEIIRKPKKTQRITKFLKVGHKNSNNNNNNNNVDESLNIKNESVDGKNKSKWFSRNKKSGDQPKEQKEKKSSESSSGRKILSFGRSKDKEKEIQNEKPEKEKSEKEKPEKPEKLEKPEKPEKSERHSKSFFPFVRSHSSNESNENSETLYITPTPTPPPITTADFATINNLIVPPMPSPPLEKSSADLLAADTLFGNNTETITPIEEAPNTEETIPTQDGEVKEKEKDKKKNKALIIDASVPKTEDISSPRRFIPSFLLSAISKNTNNLPKEEK